MSSESYISTILYIYEPFLRLTCLTVTVSGLWGLENNQLRTAALLRVYCEISGDIGVRINKKGEKRLT